MAGSGPRDAMMMHEPRNRFALILPAPTAGERFGFGPDLPDLAPARRGAGGARSILPSGIRFSQASAIDEPTEFDRRAEAHDPVARLTVYALTSAVMLFCFPLGFALLIFNILGGENLRTTAHAVALTGLGMALTTAGYAATLLAGF